MSVTNSSGHIVQNVSAARGEISDISCETLTTRNTLFVDQDLSVLGDAQVSGQFRTNTLKIYSDRRLKSFVRPLGASLSELRRLRPCTWIYNENGKIGTGFVAQEVQEVFPQAVAIDTGGLHTVGVMPLLSLIVASIQELDEKVYRRRSLCEWLCSLCEF